VYAASSATTVATANPDPAALKARIAALMPKGDTATKRALDRLISEPSSIDGTQYQCGPTEFAAWQKRSTANWTADDFTILDNLGAFDLPTYDALVDGSENDPAYALRADAQVMTKTMRKPGDFIRDVTAEREKCP